MTNPPTARFQVISQPTKRPAKCLTCGGIKHSPFIDTRIDNIDAGGRIYICSACVAGMSNALSLSDEAVDSRVQDARRAGVIEGQEQIKAALGGLLATLGDSISSIADPAVDDDGDPSDSDDEDESGEPDDAKNADQVAKQAKRSASKSRPNDVPSGGIDDLFGDS